MSNLSYDQFQINGLQVFQNVFMGDHLCKTFDIFES